MRTFELVIIGAVQISKSLQQDCFILWKFYIMTISELLSDFTISAIFLRKFQLLIIGVVQNFKLYQQNCFFGKSLPRYNMASSNDIIKTTLFLQKIFVRDNTPLCLIVGEGVGGWGGGSNCKFWEKNPQVYLIIIREWPNLICCIQCGFSIFYLSIRGIVAHDRCNIPQIFTLFGNFQYAMLCCAFHLYNCFSGVFKTG